MGEPYCYAETTLTTICAGAEFTAKGKVVLSEGWKVVERKMLGELLGKQKEPAVLKKKKEAYPDYRKARDEMQELMKAQKNVEMFFAEEKSTTEKEQAR